MSAILCADGLLVRVQNERAARVENPEEFLCVTKPIDVATRLNSAITSRAAIGVRRRGNDQVEKSVRIFAQDFGTVAQSGFTFRLRHEWIVGTASENASTLSPRDSRWARLGLQRFVARGGPLLGQGIQECVHDFPSLLPLFKPRHVSALINKFEYRIPD